ncbi:MAG: hypothetical protein DYG98_25545 [Haliscomenobacteraceae bacterium CHB4]|nr:hypothetical protein [Haliscomenobacteraceae bacterium CHB4]
MAPEIALEAIRRLRPGAKVLDPMTGSGTSLRVAGEHGGECFGFDVDPLAVLISSVWNTPYDEKRILEVGTEILSEARQLPDSLPLPWMDEETNAYIDFWFAAPQKNSLMRLAYCLHHAADPVVDVLKVALSRCIITKERGASLGRDISHAKPHKVRETNDYDVFINFQKSYEQIARRMQQKPLVQSAIICHGDARNLESLAASSIDFIITSPPYLHAVDYFRGHRLSLVWLGYSLNQLRLLQSRSIGLEKRPDGKPDEELTEALLYKAGDFNSMPGIKRSHLHRYAFDLYAITLEMSRVLKKDGEATVVIADAWSTGSFVKNTQIFTNAAMLSGLLVASYTERQIPANRRYLPPPDYLTDTDLDKRMKTEAVISFRKS